MQSESTGLEPTIGSAHVDNQRSHESRALRRIGTVIWVLAGASFVWAAVVWWWLLRAFS